MWRLIATTLCRTTNFQNLANRTDHHTGHRKSVTSAPASTAHSPPESNATTPADPTDSLL